MAELKLQSYSGEAKSITDSSRYPIRDSTPFTTYFLAPPWRKEINFKHRLLLHLQALMKGNRSDNGEDAP